MKPSTIVHVAAIPLAAIAAIWKAFAFCKIWEWFAVPVFGLPQIGMAAAFGLFVLVGLLQPFRASVKDGKEPKEAVIEALSYAFFSPAFALLFAWVAKQFM